MQTKMVSLILLIFLLSYLTCQQKVEEEPATKAGYIIQHKIIYGAADEYCAWPSIIRAGNGNLLLAFCQSEEHLSPDGAIVMLRSKDNGQEWFGPEVIYDTPLDDREVGFTILKDGSIITHYYSMRHTKKAYETTYAGSYDQATLDRWTKHVEQPEYKNATDFEGSWSTISTDDGHTWSTPYRSHDSVHGGIELKDGTLLLASYRDQEGSIGVFKASTPDHPWQKIATIHSPQPDTIRLAEPHILQLPSGRIIMMIRTVAKPYNDLSDHCFLWETYSDDKGRTWTTPFKTPLWGFPPHLLLVSDGRILCTYGYRRPPFGQRACISEDGIIWNQADEIILREDALNKDLGYPASVELEPGIILTVYYQPDPATGPQRLDPPDPNRSRPDIWGTTWKVPSK